MSLETISQSTPMEGSIAIPIASGHYGMYDQCRQLEAVLPGMAVSWKDSTSAADWRSYYKFGNALARPECAGIVATFGTSPTLSIPVSTTNADGTAVLFAGYGAVLLAPGQTVKKGQHMEPIPNGTYAGYWRVADGGHGVAESRQYASNTSETEGMLVSANVLCQASTGAGLIGAVGPSTQMTGVSVETAYDKTVTIPKNSLRVGDRLRFVTIVKADNAASGNNTVKEYINGLSGVLFTAPATTFSNNDTVVSFIDAYVASIGATGSLSLAGQLTTGTIGTATARASASSLVINTTVDNVVTVTNDPDTTADSSTLLFLSVEKL
ncbi:MAG: hypothetical protein E6Q97_36365 [Desulfurellales bacterium]|nr:MAG: hypothetical protein E6Q97_36365 [Desulfurellales bacterium]